MARYRIVKNYPTSGWVIRLKQDDIKDLNLKDGDLIDIEDAVRKTSVSRDVFKTISKDQFNRKNKSHKEKKQ